MVVELKRGRGNAQTRERRTTTCVPIPGHDENRAIIRPRCQLQLSYKIPS